MTQTQLSRTAVTTPVPAVSLSGVTKSFGTVEAVSVRDAEGFALAVQWHPEWHVLEDPASRRLFAAFGAAAGARAAARIHHDPVSAMA